MSCRQQQRRNISAFKALIASPATTPFQMPAGARVSFVVAAGASAGDTLATLAGASNRTIKARALGAGGRQVLDYIERGVTVSPSAGVEVDVDRGLSVWAEIYGPGSGGGGGAGRILTEGGDSLVTEGGDHLIVE